jgi:fructokinase
VAECDALFFTSNTLVGERERALTLAARDRALELGKPVVVDPNLRLHRWDTPARAASEARDLVKGAFLVKCNAEEARLLTGEDDAGRAAEGLLAMGAATPSSRGARRARCCAAAACAWTSPAPRPRR